MSEISRLWLCLLVGAGVYSELHLCMREDLLDGLSLRVVELPEEGRREGLTGVRLARFDRRGPTQHVELELEHQIL